MQPPIRDPDDQSPLPPQKAEFSVWRLIVIIIVTFVLTNWILIELVIQITGGFP